MKAISILGMSYKVIGLIPARFASSRFPGKPLVGVLGKPMIQRVYEQCLKSDSLSEVIVATDHPDIFQTVKSFGGKVVMTSEQHPSGTDRCMEAVMNSKLPLEDHDVIINIQGDEPFIDPAQIDLLAQMFSKEEVRLGTLVRPITDKVTYENPNCPKVVRDLYGRALYFSRAALPFFRDDDQLPSPCFQHIGIYGYRWKELMEICALKPSFLEQTEALEQLRWLENGYDIFTEISEHENHAVDSPEDLQKIEEWYSNN